MTSAGPHYPTPLLAVVGPTAVGKTALAIALARRLDGEIINADSRQVYTGMDLGTAKPTAAELRAAPHHLINIRAPDAPISLGEYLPLAQSAIADIAGRNKLPILCGGTGQYVWALLEGWQVPATPPDAALRARLERRAEQEGALALWQELQRADPQRAAATDPHNLRRIIRALEIQHYAGNGSADKPGGKAESPPYRALVIGLTMERAALYARIDARFDGMMSAGLEGEARRLAAAGYALGQGPLSGVGYRELGQYFAGALTLDAAVSRAKTQTHRLVRRQYTWFKPADARIRWLDVPDADDGLPVAAALSLAQRFRDAPAAYDTIAPDGDGGGRQSG